MIRSSSLKSRKICEPVDVKQTICYILNKTLNDWPRGKRWVLCPVDLNVTLGFASGNIKVSGKQNLLFQSGPVIKCLWRAKSLLRQLRRKRDARGTAAVVLARKLVHVFASRSPVGHDEQVHFLVGSYPCNVSFCHRHSSREDVVMRAKLDIKKIN